MTNPFTLAFGMIPAQFISRPSQTNQIIENFTADTPSTPIYMISGVRGSGKTVMLTTISKDLSARDEWVVVELNPEADLMSSLVSKLYNFEKIKPLFVKAKINLSLNSSGVTLDNNIHNTTNDVILEKMLQILKKQNKRLLIAIDEVTNIEYIKNFSHEFQILIRKEYNVYMIMTGLYENIHDLQNEKTLTFLYRAPKIILEPLNLPRISMVYSNIFNITDSESNAMAKLTQGYPFAFQVLGYLSWENPMISHEELISRYDHYLADYVYDKIWHELSDTDKLIIGAMITGSDYIKIQVVREAVGMASNQFSQHREKLIRKGIVDTSKYGYIKLTLPRFKEYAERQIEFDSL